MFPEWFEEEETGEEPLASVQVAHFCRAYGWDLYWSWNQNVEPTRWHTRDGTIPWRLFLVLSNDLAHLWSADQLNTAHGVGTAIGIAFEENRRDADDMIRALARDALPTGTD